MIQTRPRTRWVIQMSLMTVMCAVFGVWGWYDYSVKIPMDELGYQKQVAFTNVKSGLEGINFKLKQKKPMKNSSSWTTRVAPLFTTLNDTNNDAHSTRSGIIQNWI